MIKKIKNINNYTLDEVIRELSEDQGMTVSALSKKINFPGLANSLRRNNMTVNNLYKLKTYHGLDMNDLLYLLIKEELNEK